MPLYLGSALSSRDRNSLGLPQNSLAGRKFPVLRSGAIILMCDQGGSIMHTLLTHGSRDQSTAKRLSRSLRTGTRFSLVVASAVGIAAGFCSAADAEVKKVAYPEVKVTIDKVYKPDAGFDQMRAALAGAVKKKDVNALSKLIAPTFLWMIGGEPAEQLDLGRDAVQNFKVAFGFRALGKDADGGVSDGPYWETLAYFVGDANYYAASEAGNLICGPLGAGAADEEVFEQARKKVESGDDGADTGGTTGIGQDRSRCARRALIG